jgi:hypothetical protein
MLPDGCYVGCAYFDSSFAARRSRFLELHVGDIPDGELAAILEARCALAPSYAAKLVAVMRELQRRRQVRCNGTCVPAALRATPLAVLWRCSSDTAVDGFLRLQLHGMGVKGGSACLCKPLCCCGMGDSAFIIIEVHSAVATSLLQHAAQIPLTDSPQHPFACTSSKERAEQSVSRHLRQHRAAEHHTCRFHQSACC